MARGAWQAIVHEAHRSWTQWEHRYVHFQPQTPGFSDRHCPGFSLSCTIQPPLTPSLAGEYRRCLYLWKGPSEGVGCGGGERRGDPERRNSFCPCLLCESKSALPSKVWRANSVRHTAGAPAGFPWAWEAKAQIDPTRNPFFIQGSLDTCTLALSCRLFVSERAHSSCSVPTWLPLA